LEENEVGLWANEVSKLAEIEKLGVAMGRLVFILLFAVTGVVYAQQDTLMFGEIVIGKPLVIPACKNGYSDLQEVMCYADQGEKFVRLMFASGERPNYIHPNPPVKIYLKDSKVVGMYFYSTGIVSQAEVYAILEKKLGRPKQKRINKITTVGGIKHDAISAEWRGRYVNASFDGVDGSLEVGTVAVGTAELPEVMHDPDRKKKKGM
jgi:hypothetical protein